MHKRGEDKFLWGEDKFLYPFLLRSRPASTRASGKVMSLRLALKRSQEETSLKQSQADVKGQERKSKKTSKKPKKTAEGTVEERKGKAQSPAKITQAKAEKS